ncbi:MAG: universal stress protein, partial [Gammaproteobacteria bacterium]|nr:universal stress protein [Gammaproteobacteria bacterium]
QPSDANADPRCIRVLAAVDATQPDSRQLNRTILDTAGAVAGRDDAALDVVHAWQAPFDGSLPGAGPVDHDVQLADVLGLLEREHAAALTALTADYRTRLNGGDTHLARGEPAATILAHADALASDLIVLATLSRPREPGLFIGTTAEDVLQGAQTSVLALKPEGFVSPVS